MGPSQAIRGVEWELGSLLWQRWTLFSAQVPSGVVWGANGQNKSVHTVMERNLHFNYQQLAEHWKLRVWALEEYWLCLIL